MTRKVNAYCFLSFQTNKKGRQMETTPDEVTPDPATEPEGATNQPEGPQDTQAEGETNQPEAPGEANEEEVQDEE